jgi:hypothetical protein
MKTLSFPKHTESFRSLHTKTFQDDVLLMKWCDTMDLLAIISRSKEVPDHHELSVYRLSLQRVFSIMIPGFVYCITWRPDGAEIVLGGRGSFMIEEEEEEFYSASHHTMYYKSLNYPSKEQPMLWIINVDNGTILRKCPILEKSSHITKVIWSKELFKEGKKEFPQDDLFGEFLNKFPGHYVTSDDIINTMPDHQKLFKSCQSCIKELGKGV